MKKAQATTTKPVRVNLIKGEKNSKWVELYFNEVKITFLPFWYNKEYGIKAYERCAEVLFTDFAQKIVGLTREEIWKLPDYAEIQKRYDMISLDSSNIVKNFVDLELKPLVYEGNTYALAIYYKKMYMGEISYLENYPMYVYYKVVTDFFGDFFAIVPEKATQEQMDSLKNEEMNQKYDSLRGNKAEIAKILEKYL